MTGKTGSGKAGSAPGSTGRAGSFFDFLKTEKGIACILLVIALAFNAVVLWPEVGVPAFSFNDEIVHLTDTTEAAAALHQGMDPTDFWMYEFDMGSAWFHTYQHFPAVVLAVISQVTSAFFPIARLLDLSRYLLMVFFPLSIFWAMRRFDFDYPAAGISALVASLLSATGSYGFDYSSYLWWGLGLYTQLWAMCFLPLALAEIYRTIRRNGSWFWPVLLSSITLLSSLVYAFVLVVSAAVFIILTPGIFEIFSRLKRSAVIFLLTGLVTSYFFISIVLDSGFLYQSIFLQPWKYNSYGAAAVLVNLITGNLLDAGGRLPVLTVLFFLALVFVIWQWRKENYRLVLVLTVLWLCLYFGRPTWGNLLDFLPLSGLLLFHRFIGAFHLWAILLTGAGLSLMLHWSGRFFQGISFLKGAPFRATLIVIIAILLALTPVYLERIAFYDGAFRMKTATQNIFQSKSTEITEISDELAGLPPGRVYAGTSADFGDYPYYTLGSVPLQALLPQLGFDTFSRPYAGSGLSTEVLFSFDNKRQELYNLLNIRYVLLHKTWTPASYYSRIREFDDYTLYRVPTTGYFDLVDPPAVFYGNISRFYYPNVAWLGSDLPRLKENPVIVLGSRPQDTSGLPAYSFDEVDANLLAGLARQQSAAGEIVQENVSMNEYRARFTATRDCYLLLKSNYHPGWVVTLDGKNVQPVILAPGFIGIKVEPGTHQAVFTYRPPWYRLPLMGLGIFVLVLLGLYQYGKLPGKNFLKLHNKD